MTAATFLAHRFDGRYAVAVPVVVRVESGFLVVESMDRSPIERESLAASNVSDPYAHAPRLIMLRSGVTLEVSDPDGGFDRELARAGVRRSWVLRLQSYWPAAIACVVAVTAICVAAYVEGLPRATRWAAFALPEGLEARMGRRLLEWLDEDERFEPSRLDPERQARIAARFALAAERAAPGVTYVLAFRRAGADGINAFALPGGIIVLLDGIVEFGDEVDDAAVLGVLGHELGHVAHKHSTRQLLQATGIGAIGGLLWGDFSGVAASVPVVLGQFGYSREFEVEADDFSVDVLRADGGSPRALSRFLACLLEREEHRIAEGIPDILSSHPSTRERIERIDARSGGASQANVEPCPSSE